MLDISFKDYKKSCDIHGTVLYPAPMVGPMQKVLIESLLAESKIENIYDPFHGSGVSLYEAYELDNTITLKGSDINPFANLITKVKLQGVDNECILSDIATLKCLCLRKFNVEIHEFYNIDKWFRLDIKESLSIIRDSIMQIDNDKNRLFFWCMFSNIVRKYSNTRSSTYKLHVKEEIKITNLIDNSISEFISNIEKNYKLYNKNCTNFSLEKRDSLLVLKEMDNNSIDLIITSPPYGDNATTVPYGQFSSLPLFWIDRKDLELEGWELNNYSIIDYNSLGGIVRSIELTDAQNKILNSYLQFIGENKQKKVISFFHDYFEILDEIARVSNHYVVMTLGNRTVDAVKINLTEITEKYLATLGFSLKMKLDREIPNKRIPRKTSCVNNKPVDSMNEEFVIVMEKNEA